MKKIIRLTEGDLHRIIKKSVNRILRENEITGEPGEDEFNDMYHDTTTAVYHCTNRAAAIKMVQDIKKGKMDSVMGRSSGIGNAYGEGIYASLSPRRDKMYGDTIVQLVVPGSAVKPIFTKHDGGFCVLDPNDIYDAEILDI